MHTYAHTHKHGEMQSGGLHRHMGKPSKQGIEGGGDEKGRGPPVKEADVET